MSETPTTIGPYTIDRELGRGGMGVVYLGRDTRLDRAVAIKALPAHLADDPDRLARFEREARTLASLNHPNVAGIHGVEEHDGARYLVLEFVEGETLAATLDRGPLSVDEAIELAVQIAAGVEAAHDAGVVHRDLKPGNIIITPDGKAKVLDFGLARVEEGSASGSAMSMSPTMTSPAQHSPTMPGVILGTAAYMSPEQARGRRVDKRTDIWSFGVVLYEMLVGASPFAGETVSDSIGAVLHKDLDLDRLPPNTPAQVRRVLRRCLARDKAQRYRDIGDAALDLLAPQDVDAPAHPPAGAGVLPRAGLAAAILLGASVVAGALWLRPAPSGETAAAPTLRYTIPMPDGFELTGPIAISRDGTQVAYGARDERGEQHLYLRRLDGFDPVRIEGSREGVHPFFSPDGDSIGFFARNAIWRASTSGGAPTRLAAASESFGANWMEDDTILYNAGIDSPIRRMTAGGAPLDPVTRLADTTSYAHTWPQHIPGTSRVLFTAWGGTLDRRGGGHVVDLATGVARPLIDQAEFIAPGRWSASGHIILEQSDDGLSAAPFDPASDRPMTAGAARLLLGQVHHLGNSTRSVFALSDTGVMAYVPAVHNDRRLVRIAPDGATQTILDQAVVAEYAAIGGNIAISADGRQALLSGSGDIVLVDLERGIPRRMTFHDHNDRFPDWSHDERHVYFLSNREERWKIWAVPTDQSAPAELLIDHEHNLWHFSVGPSGEVAFGVTHPQTNGDIWIRDPDGQQRPLLQTPYEEREPHLSPDGLLLAYTSNVSGVEEVYIVPVGARAVPVQVTTGGGSSPKWSRDGAALFYRQGRFIMRIAVENGRPVGDAAPAFPARNLSSGAPDYDLDPDGLSMLAVQVSEEAIPREIRIVTNFFDEIRRIAGDGAIAEDRQ